MGGECGEALNVIKKLRRLDTEGDTAPANAGLDRATLMKAAADEIADMVIYADLLCARLGISLGDAIVSKFNRTSAKVGSPHQLSSPPPPYPPYKNTFVEPKPMEDVLKAAMNRKGSGYLPDHSLQFVSAHNEAHARVGWSDVEGQWRTLVAISKGDDRATPTIYIRDIRAALAELDRRQREINRLRGLLKIEVKGEVS